MHPFRNILVAYDGSEGSLRAVKIGIDMQKQLQSKITVLHVLEEKMVAAPVSTHRPDALPVSGMGAVDGLNIYTNNVKERVPTEKHVPATNPDSTEQALSEVHALLAQERVEAPVEVIQGDPAKTICQFADTNESDLIIIGSRGLGGLKKLILGSVSDKVTNTSNCPVLIAK